MSAWDWQALAACRGLDVNLFFGFEGEHYDQAAKQRREAGAKAVCASCLVSGDCDAAAEAKREHGIWSGLTEDERKARRRRESRNLREREARRAEKVA